jgi:hypothetical protein
MGPLVSLFLSAEKCCLELKIHLLARGDSIRGLRGPEDRHGKTG